MASAQKSYDAEVLKEIVKKHALWFSGNSGGECADLRSADLRSADLGGANLSSAGLFVIQTDIWTIYVHAESVRIGCKHFSHEAWLSFDNAAIGDMESRALAWWRIWKPVVSAAIDAIAYTITPR